MPATGGKAYMMLLEDVKDLAEDDEYRYVLMKRYDICLFIFNDMDAWYMNL